ncbi:putative Transcriptional regulator, LacI family [Actinacidiphila bryophytorum]|uniref:Transcriptional regulator, LacI family n=1 Tax=Actinacidiphila bryophytorum TaxID=1436133 RepID=A0A9W4H2Q9_9ACTN|nr:putative Transcriptional regulator, LacI family [Actinacidiphila bryophytorum]
MPSSRASASADTAVPAGRGECGRRTPATYNFGSRHHRRTTYEVRAASGQQRHGQYGRQRRPRGAAQARRVDGRRGPAGRGVRADRLAGLQRLRRSPGVHPQAGAAGDEGAGLPAQQRRPRPQERAVPHHRRDHLQPLQHRQHPHHRGDRDLRRGRGLRHHAAPGRRPHPGQRARRLHPAGGAGRGRHRHPHGGPPAGRRDGRAAAQRPCGGRRLQRGRPLLRRGHRPGRRGACGRRAPARPRAPHGVACGGACRLLLRRTPGRRLALGAGGGRQGGAGAAARRLVGAVRIPRRAAAGRGGGLHRGLRGERPDGAWGAARAARAGPPGPAGHQRGRLRRHSRDGLLPAPADHRPPGLLRGRPAVRGRGAAADPQQPGGDRHHAGPDPACGAPEHRAAARRGLTARSRPPRAEPRTTRADLRTAVP